MSPLISSSQKLTTFFAHRFIAFYCFHSGVTPSRVSPYIFFYLSDLVSPLFFVNLPTIFFLRVSPPGGCHPGWSAPPSPPPSDATGSIKGSGRTPADKLSTVHSGWKMALICTSLEGDTPRPPLKISYTGMSYLVNVL